MTLNVMVIENESGASDVAEQELRAAGYPLCSDSRGIWLAKDREDALSAYRRLRSRFLTQAQTARAVLRAAQRIEDPDQPSFGL